MLADPNWLLSTIVQSTAAFVAIVGGFVLSKLLAISADRRSILSRLRAVELQLQTRTENLRSLQQGLLERDANDFLEDRRVINRMVETNCGIPLAEAMTSAPHADRTEDELRPYWEAALTTAKRAFAVILEIPPGSIDDIIDLDVFLKKIANRLTPLERRICTSVYGHVVDDFLKRLEPQTINLGMGTVALPASTRDDLYAIEDEKSYRTLQRDIEHLSWQTKELEKQSSDLNSQLASLSQPEALVLGLVTLAYFAAVGIVVPVFMMPSEPSRFTPTDRFVVLLLFSSGLGVFFFYLFGLVLHPKDRPTTGSQKKVKS